MILNESQPEKSLYVIGALIIESINQKDSVFYITELYEKLEGRLEVSFAQFILAIDWLFLIGIIIPTEDGRLKKCL